MSQSQKWECPNDGTDLSELVRQNKMQPNFRKIEGSSELSLDPYIKCPGTCGLEVIPRYAGPFISSAVH